MFAGAVRETVYSRADVIERVRADFVPVAIKAALIHKPPPGPEGRYLAEVGRTQAAPQGIVAANASGKILAWALSFSSADDIPKFLDYVLERNKLYPDDSRPVVTKRFKRFPGKPMSDVADSGVQLPDIEPHAGGDDYCPGVPPKERGTFVVRVLGRRIADDGSLCGECTRQENYIEDVFDVSNDLQMRVALATAGNTRTQLPREFARRLATFCYLGMLDVRPVDPQGNQHAPHEPLINELQLFAEPIDTADVVGRRFRITGTTDVESSRQGPPGAYHHTVQLAWNGYLTIHGNHITELTFVADGREVLQWGDPRVAARAGWDPAAHLMGGRPVNVDSPVRYGLLGAPVVEEKVWRGTGRPPASAGRRRAVLAPQAREKMERLRGLLAGLAEDRVRAIMPLVQQFDKDFGAGRAAQAMQKLDEALALAVKAPPKD